TIVDITAYYKPIKDVTLTAGIFNVTDKEYYKWNDVRGSSELDLDKSQPKRNFAITAKYEF
ncbi:TonB-dependent receptor, partial [Vibrio furnissii]